MTDLEKMIWEFVDYHNEYSFLDLEKAVKLVQREAQSPHCNVAMLPVWRVLESFEENMDLLWDESERFKVAEAYFEDAQNVCRLHGYVDMEELAAIDLTIAKICVCSN